MISLDKRQVLLIQELLKNNYNKLVDLCKCLKLSEKTIRNEINKIKPILKNINVEILSIRGKGYQIKASTNDLNNLEKFLEYHKNQSDNLIISSFLTLIALSLLNNKQSIYKNTLIEKLYISKKTFIKYLKQIKEKLKDFNLKLINEKHKIIIDANERELRNFIFQIINNETNNYIENNKQKQIFFDEFSLSIIRNKIKETLNDFNMQTNENILNNLSFHIAIMLKRQNNKSFNKEYKIDNEDPNYNFAKALFLKINKYYYINEKEIFFIMEHFITNAGMLEFKNNVHNFKEIKKLVIKILKHLKNKTGLDFLNDELLINSLIMHLTSLSKRNQYNIKIQNKMALEIKQKYLLAFELSLMSSEILKDYFKIKISTSELAFIALHLGGALKRKNQNTNKIKCLIVCNYGLAFSNIILEELKENINAPLSYETCSLNMFNPKTVTKYDLVISCCDLNIDNYIKINALLNKDDIKKIDDEIKKIEENKNPFSLNNFFKIDYFFNDDRKYKNKNDFLKKYLNIMEKKNLIDKKEMLNFFKREEICSTYLDNAIAIPHTLVKKEHSYGFIIKLNKPFNWDDDKNLVKYVFILVCGHKDIKYFVEICKSIRKIIFHKNNLLKTELNYFEIIEILNS